MSMNQISDYYESAIDLLKELITTPSFSTEEDQTAAILERWFKKHDISFRKHKNNVYAFNKHYDENKPNLLLNSHHDTVKPNGSYTRDPFKADIIEDKLYGLGSNDAGGALVSLMHCFLHFYSTKNLPFNLIIAATAEEEIAGVDSLRGLLPLLPTIDLAIVGEPTLMDLAIAEKGLVVFDGKVTGTASHAAHPNDDQAIHKIIPILQWFKELRFDKVSKHLGEVKTTVSQLQAGTQHNVIPSEVKFVVDVRVNDCYKNQEIDAFFQKNAPCEMRARSLRMQSSQIDEDHALVQAGLQLGRKTYGSPTLSDQAALNCQSLKFGPGDSTRSHTADEFIFAYEIKEGIEIYIKLLENYINTIA